MQSTASGKDSVLFGENLSLRRGCFPVCRQGMPSAENLCLLSIFYIYFIFNKRNHPPRGLPKAGGHGILQLLLWRSSIGWGRQPDKQQPEDCCLQEGRQRFFFFGEP